MKKPGRPKVAFKRDIQLAVMVTPQERIILENRAKETNYCLSIFLREMGLNGAIHVKAINKDILKAMVTLSNTGSLLNQIAKKRNSFHDLDAIERATLNVLASDIAKLVDEIRATLK
jgi:hypothetical protein